jgi:peptide/nickel transport system permease protein
MILVAVMPSAFTNYDPYEIAPEKRFLGPSKIHFFGTDEMGRDLFSRTVYGVGLSLKAGLMAILIASVIGTFLGTIAGYFEGSMVGNAIMRVADIFLAFPPLVMAMAIVAALGPSLTNASMALGIVWWPQYTRLAYAQVLSARNFLYVEAARAGGVRTSRIMFIHILPNCLGSLIVKATLDIGYAILYAASLSFLGLGASPPTPELGTLVTMGRRYLLDYWWYATLPGVAIFITVMGFNLVGDGIRDAIDPNMRL